MITPTQQKPEEAQQLFAYRELMGARNQQQIIRDKVTRLLAEAQSKGLHLTTGSDVSNKRPAK